jgi:hypothetical protein
MPRLARPSSKTAIVVAMAPPIRLREASRGRSSRTDGVSRDRYTPDWAQTNNVKAVAARALSEISSTTTAPRLRAITSTAMSAAGSRVKRRQLPPLERTFSCDRRAPGMRVVVDAGPPAVGAPSRIAGLDVTTKSGSAPGCHATTATPVLPPRWTCNHARRRSFGVFLGFSRAL